MTDDDYVISDAAELDGAVRRLRLAGTFERAARADLQRARNPGTHARRPP